MLIKDRNGKMFMLTDFIIKIRVCYNKLTIRG